MAAKKKVPADSVDPIKSTFIEMERRIAEMSGSLLHEQPLQEWLLGLVALKGRVGAQLSWGEICARLHLACKAAVKNGAKVTVKGRSRNPTKREIEVFRRYLAAPKVEASVRNYLKRMHPDLWMRVKAVSNGRGAGIRRDEDGSRKKARR
jgi:hypothetical protein